MPTTNINLTIGPYVESVTGTAVDNTDPVNPIINIPSNGITGIAPVGNLLRVLTVDGGGNVVTVGASHISESTFSLSAFIDGAGSTVEFAASDSTTGEFSDFQLLPNWAYLSNFDGTNASFFTLLAAEAYLQSISIPNGAATAIGVNSSGKIVPVSSGVLSVVGGTDISIDNTDPSNPIINYTGAGGGVTSVTGTANRISSTGGATPVIDIDAAYVGQTSIVTLGTVTTGTWNSSVIAGTYGGTGINNGSNTITLAGNLVTTGAFNTTFAAQATVTTTLPPVATTLVGKTGTMAANYVPYWNDANQLTGSSLFTHTPNATNSLSLSGASAASSRISIEVQNTTASGNSSFYFQNNRGSFASYGGLFHGGSTYSSFTAFGVSSADRTVLLSDGASSLGMGIGTIVNQSVIIGTNNTARLSISGAGVFTIWDGGSFNTGTTTGVKFGTATSQKIGFWNKTPIAQPTTAITGATLTGGGGTTITATDTFGGYTLQQIAAALINTGILA